MASPQRLKRSVFRFLLGAIAVLWITLAYGTKIAELYLPVLKTSVEFFDRSHRVLELSLATEGAISGHDRVFKAVVAPVRPIVLNERLLMPHPDARIVVTLLSAYLLQPLLIGLPIVLAWPVVGIPRLALRLTIFVVLLMLLALIDLPLVLRAEVFEIYTEALQAKGFYALLAWRDFMQSGGRYALGLAMAGIAIQLDRTRPSP